MVGDYPFGGRTRPGFDRLLPHHAALLTTSAILDDVTRTRGYRSVTTKAQLLELGFSDRQARVPAVLIPVWGAGGKVSLYQARPDAPRVDPRGRAVKYETVAGARMVLDVHPVVRDRLADPAIPLWITEGVRKGDAAVSAGLCCVALLGVWNWRGTNAFGGKAALPEWESIALNDRIVYIAFDSDVMTKTSVFQALARLKAFLDSRRARVQLVYLPSGPGGAKVGLDDYLAAGHTVDELLALATAELQSFQPAPRSAEPTAPPALGLAETLAATVAHLTRFGSMAWKIIALGHLRSVRIGRAVRIRPQDLDDYLADPARER